MQRSLTRPAANTTVKYFKQRIFPNTTHSKKKAHWSAISLWKKGCYIMLYNSMHGDVLHNFAYNVSMHNTTVINVMHSE